METPPIDTVLIIDDDADTRKVFSRALRLADFNVIEATNGRMALDKLDADPCPNLVLVDLSMPQMDGADFIKQLRQHPKCAATKVAIVSGWDDLASRAKTLGANGYIRKPVDIVSLQREVLRLTQTK